MDLCKIFTVNFQFKKKKTPFLKQLIFITNLKVEPYELLSYFC